MLKGKPQVRRNYRVIARLSASTSVQETSKLYEGLNALDRAGEVDFSVAVENTQRHPRIVMLSIDGKGGSRTAAVDLSDQRDLFGSDELEEANVYFKRSFWASAVAALPDRLAAKIEPFGLSNPAITGRAAARLLLARARTGRTPGELALDARQLFALPSPRAFESPPDAPAEPLVLFQTRVWAPLRGESFDAINEERVRLVRSLRESLGRRFIGGLMPDEFARRHYPDAISDLPHGMRAYPRVVRRPLIGVYTRGLHESVAFKFSEYLAASRCIVGHRPEAELPEPLEASRHYLEFSSPDECIAQCEAVLSDPQLASAMRHSSWQYYRAEVEPSAHMRNIVRRTMRSEVLT